MEKEPRHENPAEVLLAHMLEFDTQRKKLEEESKRVLDKMAELEFDVTNTFLGSTKPVISEALKLYKEKTGSDYYSKFVEKTYKESL